MIGEAEKAKLQVGYKQAVRALNENNAEKLFIAEDCDDKMKETLASLANEKNTPVTYVPTMKELGSICEIEVSASCATVLK
ncbi:MAG: ribosomal L7Ae/L30e/S12e/Gadd45 family protein [Clostridia bacterium]|nr:ribosomal L7Ae/L30e/S12e/Gadd45 family protein [Clostridia bacterium]